MNKIIKKLKEMDKLINKNEQDTKKLKEMDIIINTKHNNQPFKHK